MKLTQKQIAERRQKAADMVGKTITVEMVQKAVSIDVENERATFVMSTANVDRHGDIVDQETWVLEHFLANPSFYFNHKSWEFPIGRWLNAWLEDDPDLEGEKRLVGEAQFTPHVDETCKRAWEHVKETNMRAVSVGLIPHVVDYDEEKDCYVLMQCELLECSLVGTPSNRQALVQDKDAKDAKDEIVEVAKQVETEVKLNPTAYNANRKRKALHLLRKAARQMQ